MRAIRIEAQGGPEVLAPAEVPQPVPGPGEALVRLSAAGVNFVDVYLRSGIYPAQVPFVPGQEGAGTVVATGANVTEVTAGDTVAWANILGAYAEYAVIPADRLVPVPDGLDPHLAAAVLLQGMTAHYLTHDTYPVQPGDTVAVHAAGGGMGTLLTRMTVLRGGTVIGTTSTPAKADAARTAGATEIVGYGSLAEAVARHTAGAGAAAVYDGVGGPTFDESLAAVRPRGVVAVYGQSGGPVPPLDLQRLNAAGSVFVTRPNLTHHVADRAELLRRAHDVFTWARDGSLPVHIGQTFPFTKAADAHAALEARATIGKTVLTF